MSNGSEVLGGLPCVLVWTVAFPFDQVKDFGAYSFLIDNLFNVVDVRVLGLALMVFVIGLDIILGVGG